MKKFLKIPVIYKLINTKNNKIYIGKAINLYRRMQRHKNDKSKDYLHNAILKHGWDNFEIEILQDYEPPIDKAIKEKLTWELLALEVAYIDFYNTLDPKVGYNVCIFGNDRTGIKHSKEAKKKMSISHQGIHDGEKNWHFGKKRSKETKEKTSKTLLLTYKNNPKLRKSKVAPDSITVNIRKPVKQIDKNTGQVIKIWESTWKAACSLGKPKGTSEISYVCRKIKNRKSAFGFYWEYA